MKIVVSPPGKGKGKKAVKPRKPPFGGGESSSTAGGGTGSVPKVEEAMPGKQFWDPFSKMMDNSNLDEDTVPDNQTLTAPAYKEQLFTKMAENEISIVEAGTLAKRFKAGTEAHSDFLRGLGFGKNDWLQAKDEFPGLTTDMKFDSFVEAYVNPVNKTIEGIIPGTRKKVTPGMRTLISLAKMLRTAAQSGDTQDESLMVLKRTVPLTDEQKAAGFLTQHKYEVLNGCATLTDLIQNQVIQKRAYRLAMMDLPYGPDESSPPWTIEMFEVCMSNLINLTLSEELTVIVMPGEEDIARFAEVARKNFTRVEMCYWYVLTSFPYSLAQPLV